MLATLVCSLIPPLHYEIGSRSVHWELSIQNRFHEKSQSNLPPSAKYAPSSGISFGSEKLRLRFIMRQKLHMVIQLWIVWVCSSCVVSLKALRDNRRLTVDELPVMFLQISSILLHETITETLGYQKLSTGPQNSWQTNTSWNK